MKGISFNLKIIIVGPNYDSYNSASYQRDFLTTVESLADEFFHANFNGNINATDLIKLAGFHPDVIIYNHGWLNEIGETIASSKISGKWPLKKIKHVIILNKEYNRLKEKIDYINNANFDLIVTHYHKLENIAEFNTEVFFMPLAYSRCFENDMKPIEFDNREYDFAFSGILQNPNAKWSHTDIRQKIQEELFYCFFDLPLFKKLRYRNLNLYWRPFYAPSIPPGPITLKIKFSILKARIKNKLVSFLFGKRLNQEEYKNLLRNSKTVMHTASTLGIIGTRVFEVLRSGALGLFSKDSEASVLLKPGFEYIEFGSVTELLNKIYLIKNFSNNEIYKKISSNGLKSVRKNHNWEKRVKELFEKINNIAL